ncbi:MAG TPA: ABC transporter permease subunit [Verrucomicrobiae bacterium]|nr:ABC transporter permease subunit [Verrucomicrobiae bacterium]
MARRELRAAARNPKLYAWRVRVGVLELIVAAVLILEQNVRRSSGGAFWFLAGIALVFCLLDGLRKAADSISLEKREGTLGLLLLSGIGGGEVILGKFVSAIVRSLNGLLAFVPVLALTLLFGGVTGAEFWRIVLALLLTLLASTSLCLLVSALFTEDSAIWALGLLAALCTLPWLIFGVPARITGRLLLSGLASLSPVVLFNNASASATLMSSRPFWIGTSGIFLISIMGLIGASRVVRGSWREKARPMHPRKTLWFGRSEQPQRQHQLLDINPFYWLAFNQPLHRLYLLLCLGAFLLGTTLSAYVTLSGPIFAGSNRLEAAASPVMFTLSLLFIMAGVRVASQSSKMLVEAQRSGFLELAMGTPIKAADVIEGQWSALRRTIMPVLVVTAVVIAVSLLFLFSRPRGALIITGLLLLHSILVLYVIGWVGMWMALSSKTPGRAFFKTILVGFFISNGMSCCGVPLLFPLILLFVARRKVHRLLPALFNNVPPGELFAPPLVSAVAPPVIR